MRARWLARLLRGPLLRLAERRPPDFVIGGDDDPYLRRWFLIPRNPVFNVYLHNFVRSDDDRALHDHPWVSLGLILQGRYTEVTADLDAGNHVACQHFGLFRHRSRGEGAVVLRWPTSAHRVELILDPMTMDDRLMPVWTLFVTGPRVREWGFWCAHGWRHWKDFTAGSRGETVGRGCD